VSAARRHGRNLAVPRDRQSSFDPQLIARYQRRFPGFEAMTQIDTIAVDPILKLQPAAA